MKLDTRKLRLEKGGWVLVEAQPGRRYRRAFSSLLIGRASQSGQLEELQLPILTDGRIVELIDLPAEAVDLAWRPPEPWDTGLAPPTVRRIGWPERVARMWTRILRVWARLAREDRRESGLSPWRALRDLAGAYRTAGVYLARHPMLDYPAWIERFDTLGEGDIASIRDHVARFARAPHFHVLIAAGEGRLSDTLASLRGQIYRNFTCTVVGDAGSSPARNDAGAGSPALLDIVDAPALPGWLSVFNAALGGRADDRLMLLRAGDVLPAHGLYRFACEILAQPGAAVLYSDDDSLDGNGRRVRPRLKPDWSPEHLRSTHYVGAAAAMRCGSVAAAGGIGAECCRHGNYDLLLRMIEAPGAQVVHVPAILLHRSGAAAGAWEDPDWSLAALRRHLERTGIAAEATSTLSGCRRVRYRLPEAPPLVSIIVPTRNAEPLLRQCLESIFARTAYPSIELLVIDNQSDDPGTLDYFRQLAARPNVRVLRYDRPFNYAAINNFAAGEARGTVLCLLNNDTEVIHAGWLDEMMGHLLRDGVGVVGAKLLFASRRVQHGGVAVGVGGCANHLHVDLGPEDPGYCNRAAIAHEVSAVTAACMLTRRDLYERLHGLDAAHLPVAFNDVDYCLRVRQAGYRVIYTPHCPLLHHESASRGEDKSLRRRLRAMCEVRFMRRTWRECMRHDPYYNPNLSYSRPDFSLSEWPRARKPWIVIRGS